MKIRLSERVDARTLRNGSACLVNVHDPQSALQLRILARALHQLLQSQPAVHVHVDPVENALQEPLVVFQVLARAAKNS